MEKEIKNTEQQIAKWFKTRNERYSHDIINKEPLSSHKKRVIAEELLLDYWFRNEDEDTPLKLVNIEKQTRVEIFLDWLGAHTIFERNTSGNTKEIIRVGELAWYSDYEEVIEYALLKTYEADLDILDEAKFGIEMIIDRMTCTGQCRRHDEVI